MPVFEYKTLNSFVVDGEWKLAYGGAIFSIYELDSVFSSLGKLGWELISVSTLTDSKVKSSFGSALTFGIGDTGVTHTSGEIFYFKRELSSESEYSDHIKIGMANIDKVIEAVDEQKTFQTTMVRAVPDIVSSLNKVGYKVVKKSDSKWKIIEPLGGTKICHSYEELWEYSEGKIPNTQ